MLIIMVQNFTSQSPLFPINSARLQRNLEELAAIGRRDDGGVYRMFGSEGEMLARRWFEDKLEQAGMAVRTDGALNIFGRYGDIDAPCVLTGSHIDSVPGGGHLDGALGVVAGLECLLQAKDLSISLKRPIEAAVFTDEEGRFGGMFGSQAMCGHLTPGFVHTAIDQAGCKLADVLAAYDAHPMGILAAQRAKDDIDSFVELHIEQGPVLDATNHTIGIVQAISGVVRWSVTLIGAANHAGTTPMEMRKDALCGFAEIAQEIPRIVEEDGTPSSRATIGRVTCFPAAANVIPGQVDFSIDIRDTNLSILTNLKTAFNKTMTAITRRRGLQLRLEEAGDLLPVKMDEGVQSMIESVAEESGLRHLALASGAAHDCQQLARLTRAGMIFVPSKEGRSHSPAEWTSWDDIAAGTQTLFNVLLRLANA